MEIYLRQNLNYLPISYFLCQNITFFDAQDVSIVMFLQRQTGELQVHTVVKTISMQSSRLRR